MAIKKEMSDFLCLSHTLNQEAEYGDQERDSRRAAEG